MRERGEEKKQFHSKKWQRAEKKTKKVLLMRSRLIILYLTRSLPLNHHQWTWHYWTAYSFQDIQAYSHSVNHLNLRISRKFLSTHLSQRKRQRKSHAVFAKWRRNCEIFAFLMSMMSLSALISLKPIRLAWDREGSEHEKLCTFKKIILILSHLVVFWSCFL